jgi:hypothetical protein
MQWDVEGSWVARAAGSDHSGIAFCPRTGRFVSEIIRSLLLIYELCRPEEIENRVEYP